MRLKTKAYNYTKYILQNIICAQVSFYTIVVLAWLRVRLNWRRGCLQQPMDGLKNSRLNCSLQQMALLRTCISKYKWSDLRNQNCLAARLPSSWRHWNLTIYIYMTPNCTIPLPSKKTRSRRFSRKLHCWGSLTHCWSGLSYSVYCACWSTKLKLSV